MVEKKRKARILFWVLADTVKNRTIYFHEWTNIGPCGTRNLKQAERFKTKQAAMNSPAFTFPLTFYEPTPIRKGTWGEVFSDA